MTDTTGSPGTTGFSGSGGFFGLPPAAGPCATLDEAATREVLELLAAIERADGVAAFGEQPVLDLRHPSGRPVRHVVLRDGGRVVAYGQVDLGSGHPASTEIGVHADARRRGAGSVVLGGLRQAVADGAGTGEAGGSDGTVAPIAGPDPVPELAVWAHGDLPAARAFARAQGLERSRELHLMALDLSSDEPPATPPSRQDVRIDAFRPGVDEEAWVDLNALAFAAHPEQGRMTTADLRARAQEPWFDPARFWFARPANATNAADAAPLASMWVKAVPGEDDAEIYVLAVHPGAQGRGLGGLLTAHAISDARARGAARVTLYVDGDNEAAVRVYRRAGFEIAATDVQYTG